MRMGKLGNQSFELAALWGMAKELGYSPEIPLEWPYQEYFKHEFTVGEKLPFDNDTCEPAFEFIGWDWWKKSLKRNGDVLSISGWLQSSKYWNENREWARKLFEFKDEFAYPLIIKYRDILDANRETIAITVRVGQDYKDNGNYEILSITYYLGALFEKFPSWRNYNILIFSDDAAYCKLNFTHENMHVIEENDISQLFLASRCKHFILANSTFSWWASYLSKGEGYTLYPSKYYKHTLEDTNLRDFWLGEWEPFRYDYKMDFRDVTFTIPVTYDHPHRLENYDVCINYLYKHLLTNIFVGERALTSSSFERDDVEHYTYKYPTFHRTRMLNELANQAETPYIVNMDADVFIPVLQIYLAVEALRNGISMIYPYDGRFARLDRGLYMGKMKAELDCGYFKSGEPIRGTRTIDPPSFGGAIFWNKEDFIYGGMENENMISYGPEDYERYHRFTHLGYKVVRIPGTIYHMDHWVGPDSGGGGNPNFDPNHREYDRIKLMGNEELLEEINKWPWVNHYLSGYYEEITEGSVRSAKEIFKSMNIVYSPLVPEIKSIIDVSGGCGGWWKGIREYGYTGEYKMTDWRVPKHKLIVPRNDYAEYDLTNKDGIFPFNKKFDLSICVEVGEHIPEEYASSLIELLCTLGHSVLFSAAIPHQGGSNHVNEQWGSWWADLFAKHGYYPLRPLLRDYVRNVKDIELWYKNNIILYSPKAPPSKLEDYVHPELYTNIIGSLTEWQ